jgi:ATP-dependent DNA ligase
LPVDVCTVLAVSVSAGVVLYGELIIWDTHRGRTSFAALQRRFTAGRRLTGEVRAWPAHFVAFDLLQDGRHQPVLEQPLGVRYGRLQRLLAGAPPAITQCRKPVTWRLLRAGLPDGLPREWKAS